MRTSKISPPPAGARHVSLAPVGQPGPAAMNQTGLAALDQPVPAVFGQEATGEKEPVVPFGVGLYQLLALFNSMLSGTAFLSHLFSVRLTAHVMDHWCRQPTEFANLSAAEWKEMAIPRTADGTYSHCARREPPDGGSETVSCDSWDFDLSEYGDNIVSEWQLVCNRRLLLDLALYTTFLASVLWLPMMGLAADRVGRRIVVYISIPALLITGFASSVTASFQFFVALRTVVSASIVSVMVVAFVVLYEATPAGRRTLYCFTAMALSQVFAIVPFAVVSALKLSWKVVYLLVMVPTSLLVITLYTMDESYPWLLATWRTKDAERLALDAARMNGVSSESCRALMSHGYRGGNAEIAAGRSAHSIFSAELRRRTLVISCFWAATNFSYSQANLSDIFPLHPAAELACILLLGPVHVVLCPAIRYVGLRRVVVGSALIFSAVSLLLASTYRMQTALSGNIVVVVLRLLGNLTTSLATFLAVAAYPTTARCTGLAFAFAVGRLAGSCGEILFHLMSSNRKDFPVAAMSISMALVTMAAEQHLPDVDAGLAAAVDSAHSQRTGATPCSVRTMQDTLDPMVRGHAGRARGRRHHKRDSAPEHLPPEAPFPHRGLPR